jgi:1-aminocyclopropane-1-carboxylate deaminase/D-cysteine desulfhydrase-like pyridoxal-dependent ACC family enzyme
MPVSWSSIDTTWLSECIKMAQNRYFWVFATKIKKEGRRWKVLVIRVSQPSPALGIWRNALLTQNQEDEVHPSTNLTCREWCESSSSTAAVLGISYQFVVTAEFMWVVQIAASLKPTSFLRHRVQLVKLTTAYSDIALRTPQIVQVDNSL